MKQKLLYATVPLALSLLLSAGCGTAAPSASPSRDSSTQQEARNKASRHSTPASGIDDELPTLIGAYQGFTDRDTAEFEIDGNILTFQVYDTELVSQLSAIEKDTDLTFAVDINENTEMRTIIRIIPR